MTRPPKPPTGPRRFFDPEELKRALIPALIAGLATSLITILAFVSLYFVLHPLDELQKGQAKLSGQLYGLDIRVTAIDQRVGTLDTRVNDLTVRLPSVRAAIAQDELGKPILAAVVSSNLAGTRALIALADSNRQREIGRAHV